MSNEEKNWGVYCHLAAFLGLILPGFGNFLGPIIVWVLKKDTYPFVDEQGKEVINFQITVLAMSILAGVLTILLIGVFLLWLLPIYWAVMTLYGAVKVNEAEHFRYPYTIRLL